MCNYTSSPSASTLLSGVAVLYSCQALVAAEKEYHKAMKRA